MKTHATLEWSLAALAAGAMLSAASLAQAAEAAIAADGPTIVPAPSVVAKSTSTRPVQPDAVLRPPSASDGLIAPASLNAAQARASLAILVRATIKPPHSVSDNPVAPLRTVKPRV